MSSVKIKLTQDVVNKLDALSGSSELLGIAGVFDTVVSINQKLNYDFFYAPSWSWSPRNGTATFNLQDDATLIFTGSLSNNHAIATSRVLTVPGAIKESISGEMHYDYVTYGRSIAYWPSDSPASTISTYKVETLANTDPTLGKVGIAMTGALHYSGSGSNLSGTVTSLSVSATSFLKSSTIEGNLSVTGQLARDSNDVHSTVSGTLTKLTEKFYDGSVIEASGSVSYSGSYLNDSFLDSDNAWAGDDTLDVTLPSTLTTEWQLNTGAGNDTIKANGGNGHLIINGGDGDDQFTLTDRFPVIEGGSGTDTIISGFSYDAAWASGIENLSLSGNKNLNLTGSSIANVLTGNAGANTLDGKAGNDTLIGGAGKDTLIGGTGADLMDGGSGNDTYDVDHADDLISDTSGTDLVRSSVSLTLISDLENLTLLDAAVSGIGNASANTIIGNAGANQLFGAAGNDSLNGADGNDFLDGGSGADRMSGGKDDDIYIVDNTKDVVVEIASQGTDEIRTSLASYSLAKLGAVENLTYYGLDNSTLTGNSLGNAITGSGGQDKLVGGGGNDLLYGLAGIDQIDGGDGNDSLDGGAGNDSITGGTGLDTMTGGSGSDTFLFVKLTDSTTATPDVITDFSSLEGDLINLVGLDANTLQKGNNGFAFAGTSAAANSVWYQSIDDGILLMGDVNGNTTPDFSIKLVGVSSLAASDFITGSGGI